MDGLQSIIIRSQDGDLEAFQDLVQRFQGLAYSFAYTLLNDAQLAEDVSQEAFIEAFQCLGSLREPQAFGSWLRRIVFKQADRLLRRKQLSTVPLDTQSFDIPISSLNPALIVEKQERQDLVRELVSHLSDHERLVVQLFYGSEYSLKEIAQFLDLPLSTVKKRLFDARKRLKSRFMEVFSQSLFIPMSNWDQQFSQQVQLLIAVHQDDIERVRALLEQDVLLVNTQIKDQAQARPGSLMSLPYGYTALHVAVMKGHLEIARLLLEYGAYVNSRTSTGITPLHEAVFTRQAAIVLLLLRYGASINLANGARLTPLHWACMQNNPELTQLLLDHGADPNSRGQQDLTPLHWVALKGFEKIIPILLVTGADSQLLDALDRTPLDLAHAYRQADAILLLQKSTRIEGTG